MLVHLSTPSECGWPRLATGTARVVDDSVHRFIALLDRGSSRASLLARKCEENWAGGCFSQPSARANEVLRLVVIVRADLADAHAMPARRRADPRRVIRSWIISAAHSAAITVTITTAWPTRCWRGRPGRQSLISCKPQATSAAPTEGQSPPLRRCPRGSPDRRAQCAMRRRRPCSLKKPGGPKRRVDPRGGRRAPSPRRSGAARSAPVGLRRRSSSPVTVTRTGSPHSTAISSSDAWPNPGTASCSPGRNSTSKSPPWHVAWIA
jgi:hypothetical protein